MTQTISPRLDVPGARPSVSILADRCAGCQECVIRCPTGALSMDPLRWVALADSDLCVGCRQCERTCPFSAVVVEGPTMVAPRHDTMPEHPVQLLGDVREIRAGYDGWAEVLAEAERCLQCPDPTCVRGCPAHNDIPGFIAAVRREDLAGAHEVLARTSVIPDICSRVCNQAAQCEGACSWSLAGAAPVSIGRIERFIADHHEVPAPRPTYSPDPMSVGIVGSGPAATGAAWDLVEAGAHVTVYEKDAVPGGLCTWGIPDFTLAEEIARRPWRQLEAAGVDLRCEVEIHAADVERLLAVHDAVIVAHGAGVPLRLNVPGADLEGVVDATLFLKGAQRALESAGEPEKFLGSLGLGARDAARSAHVLVLGAGNTAMDVARTARRLGLEATCIDWLDERFALARPDEVAEARHEGVDIRFTHTLTELSGAGRVARARLARTVQEHAHKKPRVLDHDAVEMEVDLVVMAMGYRNDPAFNEVLPGTPVRRETSGVPDRRWRASGLLAPAAASPDGRRHVGALALTREVGLWAAALPVSERLWVAGDALTGPATVVEAMAQGRRAARAVLDARPARPGDAPRYLTPRPPRVLVCYASVGGTTARAAQEIADGFAERGLVATVLPIEKVGARELAGADALVMGTWVEGFVVAGVGPAKTMRAWLARLPRLGATPVALFCTYAVAPKNTLDAMRRAVEARGAVVVADAAFGRGDAARAAAPRAFGLELANQVLARQGASASAS